MPSAEYQSPEPATPLLPVHSPVSFMSVSFVGRFGSVRFGSARSISYVSGCQRPSIQKGRGIGKTYRSLHNFSQPAAPPLFFLHQPPLEQHTKRESKNEKSKKKTRKRNKRKPRTLPPQSLPSRGLITVPDGGPFALSKGSPLPRPLPDPYPSLPFHFPFISSDGAMMHGISMVLPVRAGETSTSRPPSLVPPPPPLAVLVLVR